MILLTIVNGTRVRIDLPGVSEEAYQETSMLLSAALAEPTTKNRDAISVAFLHVLGSSPGANASDLWHHVVYRVYCDIYRDHRPQDPKQSWVRASGDALEQVVERIYTPVLAPRGIAIRALISGQEKARALAAMGLAGSVGSAKLDVALYRTRPEGQQIFGGVHVKASLAERVSDDVPASRAMMAANYFSPIWTLDVKSFPPPHGDLVNRGELGTPDVPSEKRRYIEEHGDFDNCYSANARTVPSAGGTRSGNRVFTLDLLNQPDQFARDILARSEAA